MVKKITSVGLKMGSWNVIGNGFLLGGSILFLGEIVCSSSRRDSSAASCHDDAVDVEVEEEVKLPRPRHTQPVTLLLRVDGIISSTNSRARF